MLGISTATNTSDVEVDLNDKSITRWWLYGILGFVRLSRLFAFENVRAFDLCLLSTNSRTSSATAWGPNLPYLALRLKASIEGPISGCLENPRYRKIETSKPPIRLPESRPLCEWRYASSFENRDDSDTCAGLQ